MIRTACVHPSLHSRSPRRRLARKARRPRATTTRYTFNRADDGYLRLDGRTGQVSICTRRPVGWACQAVPDERTALEAEIARLQGENVALKKELIARNLPLPGTVKPEPPAAKPEEPRAATAQRRRSQQGHDLHREGLAPPGRDDRDAAEGHSEQELMFVRSGEAAVTAPLSAIDQRSRPMIVATATLAVETGGQGFTDITRDVARLRRRGRAKDGALLIFMRHTSASLVIQENADPDVRVDLAYRARPPRARRCRLGPRRRGARRHAGAREDHAHRRVAARAGHRRRARARHLAGHLSSPSTAPGRTGARSCCSSSAAGVSVVSATVDLVAVIPGAGFSPSPAIHNHAGDYGFRARAQERAPRNDSRWVGSNR